MKNLKEHINNNIEFYINGVFNQSFPDKYPDRPMYLEAVFYDVNKKVENLYIYKEVLKTHDTIQTTEMVAKVDGYKYGFNGMLKDDQIKGRGNSYDFGARMQDPRLGGRFFSIDAFANKFASQSPYAFAGNSPIMAIDVNGDSIYIARAIYKRSVQGLKIMTATNMGRKVYEKFLNSKTTNIYIYGYDDNDNSTTVMQTTYIAPGGSQIDKRGNVNYKGQAEFLNDWINASGFKLSNKKRNFFIGRNLNSSFTSKAKMDEYDMAFAFYHEMKSHIEDGTGNEREEHEKFGNIKTIPGLSLFENSDYDGKTIFAVKPNTNSWDFLKELLHKKINDGKATKQNIKHYEMMNDYEKNPDKYKKYEAN